jgi:hypothetical protein
MQRSFTFKTITLCINHHCRSEYTSFLQYRIYVSNPGLRSPPINNQNAGNIGLRIPEYVKNHHSLGVNQFVFDYRGYGLSDAASPTEAGLVADAIAAYEYLQVE